MVVRASDTRRTLAGTIRDNRARTDEVARRQGRGASSLRNSQGQAFELDPGSGVPLLVPYAEGVPTGSAQKFTRDGVEIVDPVDGERRDLLARSLTLTQHINIGGEVRAALGIRAEGGLSSVGDTAVGATLSVGVRARAPNWSSDRYDGALRWNANGAVEVVTYDGSAFRGVYASNFAPPPSWRGMKRDFATVAEQLGRPARRIVDDLDVRFHRYDPEQVPDEWDTDELRLGPMLDELPSELRHSNIAEDGTDHSSYDVVKMLGLALADLQELSAEVHELRAEVTRLRAASTS